MEDNTKSTKPFAMLALGCYDDHIFKNYATKETVVMKPNACARNSTYLLGELIFTGIVCTCTTNKCNDDPTGAGHRELLGAKYTQPKPIAAEVESQNNGVVEAIKPVKEQLPSIKDLVAVRLAQKKDVDKSGRLVDQDEDEKLTETNSNSDENSNDDGEKNVTVSGCAPRFCYSLAATVWLHFVTLLAV